MQHPAVFEFISDLPDNLQPRAEGVRELIFECIPRIRESIKYDVPFYDYHGALCYLAYLKKKQLVLGFIRGTELSDFAGKLVAKDRKQIRHWVLDEDELNEELLMTYLQEAALLNEEHKKND